MASNSALKIDIKNRLLSGTKILGNNQRRLKNLCSDLLNQDGRENLSKIMNGTHLSYVTIDRMMSLSETETGRDYRPCDDTIERILIYYGVELTTDQVSIGRRFQNKPKKEAE